MNEQVSKWMSEEMSEWMNRWGNVWMNEQKKNIYFIAGVWSNSHTSKSFRGINEQFDFQKTHQCLKDNVEEICLLSFNLYIQQFRSYFFPFICNDSEIVKTLTFSLITHPFFPISFLCVMSVPLDQFKGNGQF